MDKWLKRFFFLAAVLVLLWALAPTVFGWFHMM
jgi:hypothetical protein